MTAAAASMGGKNSFLVGARAIEEGSAADRHGEPVQARWRVVAEPRKKCADLG